MMTKHCHLRVFSQVDEGRREGCTVGKGDEETNASGADVMRSQVVGHPSLEDSQLLPDRRPPREQFKVNLP